MAGLERARAGSVRSDAMGRKGGKGRGGEGGGEGIRNGTDGVESAEQRGALYRRGGMDEGLRGVLAGSPPDWERRGAPSFTG